MVGDMSDMIAPWRASGREIRAVAMGAGSLTPFRGSARRIGVTRTSQRSRAAFSEPSHPPGATAERSVPRGKQT